MIGCGLSSVVCGLHSHQAVPFYAVLQHILYILPCLPYVFVTKAGWLGTGTTGYNCY